MDLPTHSDHKIPAVIDTGRVQLSDELKELAGDTARRRLFDLVRAELSRSGLKQADLAYALGVNPATISRMLSSPRNLTIESAGRLMIALGEWLDFHTSPLKHSNIATYTVAYDDGKRQWSMIGYYDTPTVWLVLGNDGRTGSQPPIDLKPATISESSHVYDFLSGSMTLEPV